MGDAEPDPRNQIQHESKR